MDPKELQERIPQSTQHLMNQFMQRKEIVIPPSLSKEQYKETLAVKVRDKMCELDKAYVKKAHVYLTDYKRTRLHKQKMAHVNYDELIFKDGTRRESKWGRKEQEFTSVF